MPSFNQQAFGMMDLNSVAFDTSPAQIVHTTQHPSDQQYARYLLVVAHMHDLPVIVNTDVTAVTPLGKCEPKQDRKENGIISYLDKDCDDLLRVGEFCDLRAKCENDVPTKVQWELMLNAMSSRESADAKPGSRARR